MSSQGSFRRFARSENNRWAECWNLFKVQRIAAGIIHREKESFASRNHFEIWIRQEMAWMLALPRAVFSFAVSAAWPR